MPKKPALSPFSVLNQQDPWADLNLTALERAWKVIEGHPEYAIVDREAVTFILRVQAENAGAQLGPAIAHAELAMNRMTKRARKAHEAKLLKAEARIAKREQKARRDANLQDNPIPDSEMPPNPNEVPDASTPT